MDGELLDLLVCPKSKKKLTMAPSPIVEEVNRQIAAKLCKDIGGDDVTETVQEALYEPQGKIVYLIRDGIPVLIYENGIIIQNN